MDRKPSKQTAIMTSAVTICQFAKVAGDLNEKRRGNLLITESVSVRMLFYFDIGLLKGSEGKHFGFHAIWRRFKNLEGEIYKAAPLELVQVEPSNMLPHPNGGLKIEKMRLANIIRATVFLELRKLHDEFKIQKCLIKSSIKLNKSTLPLE